jgi:ribosomal protein S18 acetylase RimI-like enzyme
MQECFETNRIAAVLGQFGGAARFPLALLDRPGPGACRFWTSEEDGGVAVVRLGGNILPLFRSGCGSRVAEWLRAQSGSLTQMMVPEPLGEELLATGRLPPHHAPVRETLAEMRELRAHAPSGLCVASPQECAQLARLYRPNSFVVAEFLPFPERFRYALETGRFCYLQCDGRPVAACHTLPEASGIGQVMGVITDPEYRGRGLGREVVAGLCRMLLDDDLTPQIFYETGNQATRSLYRSLGFVDRIPYLAIDFL